ncbi:hypothetical protein PQR15_22885 [Streptomyces lydicus]|nr:hypothetical protein [Streptomyces lydicus]
MSSCPGRGRPGSSSFIGCVALPFAAQPQPEPEQLPGDDQDGAAGQHQADGRGAAQLAARGRLGRRAGGSDRVSGRTPARAAGRAGAAAEPQG